MTRLRHGLPGVLLGHGRPGITELLAAAAAGSTLLSGLISWWDLDEESGTRADAVGSNDLTDVNTVTYASGKIGNASSHLSTNNEYLQKASGFTAPAAFTVSAWIKADALTQSIISAVNSWAAGAQFELYISSGILYLLVSNNTGSYAYCTQSPAASFTTGWFHVVGWYDQSEGVPYVAINNVASSSNVGTNATTYNTASSLRIGTGTGAAAWTGAIDMVGLWNRVLTSDERTELYNLGAGIKNTFIDNGEGFRQGLVSYWKLDETSGIRADSVGSNDLTDNNTVGSTTGVSGNAADFVAANSERLSLANFIAPASYTVTGWANFDQTNTDGIIGAIGTWPNSVQFAIYQSTANTLRHFVGDGSAFKSATTISPSGTAWNSVGWFFFAATFNAADKTPHIQVNQLGWDQSAAGEALAGTPYRTAATLNISLTGGPNYADGKIDEVSVWNRVLSADEIAALYASGAGRFYDFNTL